MHGSEGLTSSGSVARCETNVAIAEVRANRSGCASQRALPYVVPFSDRVKSHKNMGQNQFEIIGGDNDCPRVLAQLANAHRRLFVTANDVLVIQAITYLPCGRRIEVELPLTLTVEAI